MGLSGTVTGLGPGCAPAPFGSVFVFLEAAPQLLRITLASVTCGDRSVLASVTACQFIFFVLSCFAMLSQFNC